MVGRRVLRFPGFNGFRRDLLQIRFFAEVVFQYGDRPCKTRSFLFEDEIDYSWFFMSEASFTEPKQGVAFHNGKLYLFEANRIWVLRAWPPYIWEKTRQNPAWRGARLVYLDICLRTGLDEQRISQEGDLPLHPIPPALPFVPPSTPEQPHTPEEAIAWKSAIEIHSTRSRLNVQNCFRACLSPVPARVRLAMVQSTSKWYQWNILRFCARVPNGLELAETNPALAFILPSINALEGGREGRVTNDVWRLARRVIGWKQSKILERVLGFPGRPWVAGVVRKLAPRSCNISRIRELRNLIWQSPQDRPLRKALCHLPRINSPVLEILSRKDLSACVSNRLLQELGQSTEEDQSLRLVYLLEDVLALRRMLGHGIAGFRLSSLNVLRTHHDTLCDRLHVTPGQLAAARWNLAEPGLETALNVLRKPFPKPPLDGCETIQRITSIEALSDWGHQEHNCVETYVYQILCSKVYIYAVLAPQKATLAIAPSGRGWGIRQLLAARNASVERKTYLHVMEWLKRSTSSSQGIPMASSRRAGWHRDAAIEEANPAM